MRILVSGSSGFVGSALAETLSREGHRVGRLVRPGSSARGPGDVRWDHVSGEFDAATAEGTEAVVHLAGAPLAETRWNDARKRILRSSRVEATHHLVSALAKLACPPQVFVSASAIGYYGDRGDEELSEESTSGSDFLAALARDWEAEAARAAQFGARSASLRFGIILSPRGGALARMLTPFRLGLGGRLGPGTQWMSWLTLEEAIGMIGFALSSAQARGAINAVAPRPVRNAEFTKALGKVLRRPTIFPAPAFALRLALGEIADVALLASQRVLPRKLQQLGYSFRQPELELALATLLGRAS